MDKTNTLNRTTILQKVKSFLLVISLGFLGRGIGINMKDNL